MSRSETIERWTKNAAAVLEGRTIKRVRYLTDEEREHLGWYHLGIVIELDNGLAIWPSRDDEGNDAGALFTTSVTVDTIPVI